MTGGAERRPAPRDDDLSAELAFALDLLDRSAEVATEVFRRPFEVRAKPDATPVTEADLRIEALVADALLGRFPEDALLGEEGGLRGPPEARRRWIVDPIDGTKNFAAGIPVWATLLALAIDGRVVLGVVGAPAIGERYEGVAGHGARFNGRPIRVTSETRLDHVLMSTAGIGAWLGGPHERAFLSLAAEADRVRGFGDFWGHMLVARGAAGLMLETALRVWDYAPLQVIVEEAGGRMTQIDGAPLADGGSALSAPPTLHVSAVARFRGEEPTGDGSEALPPA